MLLVTGLCARNSPVKIGWFRLSHDDVIKWKHFPRHWPFVRGIHRSPVNSPHKGQWRGALMFYLICAWTNSWANNREAGDLGRHRAHYDVIVMFSLGYDCCQVTIGSNNSLKQNRRKSIFQTNDNLVQWCICQEFQALAVFRSIVIYKYIYIYMRVVSFVVNIFFFIHPSQSKNRYRYIKNSMSWVCHRHVRFTIYWRTIIQLYI